MVTSNMLGLGILETTAYTPVYFMHKYWARRPWKVFSKIIQVFTEPGDIILDPFAGGGTTLIEGLILRRKVVAVDLNPLACMVMKKEVEPLNIYAYREVFNQLKTQLEPLAWELYGTKCPECGSKTMVRYIRRYLADDRPFLAFIYCKSCNSKIFLESGLEEFEKVPDIPPKWYPVVQIPEGDTTNRLIQKGFRYFHELISPRSLIMLSHIRDAITQIQDDKIRDFMMFTFSSMLEWSSKMSKHLKGGETKLMDWTLNTYWVAKDYTENNLWEVFCRRVDKVIRGKTYTNSKIGSYAKEASDFSQLQKDASYMVVQADSRDLSFIPDESVDAVITDPPYGDIIQYAELSDFYLVWLGLSAPKTEISINSTRRIGLREYEDGLYQVFRECFRVLKHGGHLISTFNIGDMNVMAAFVLALRRAGFKYVDVLRQPVYNYKISFHVEQKDPMPYDFVFVFKKSDEPEPKPKLSFVELLSSLDKKIKEYVNNGKRKSEYRLDTYPQVIQYISSAPFEIARKFAKKYESMIREYSSEFNRNKMEHLEKKKGKKKVQRTLLSNL